MILFQTVVQIAACPVFDLLAQLVADRLGIGVMAIGGHAVRHTTYCRQCRGEKLLGCHHVTGLTETHVDQTAITIDRPIEVTPATFNLEIRLIDIPADPSFASSLGPQPIGQDVSQFAFPLVHRIMAKLQPAIQKHLGQIMQAEFVAQPSEHHQTDHVVRILETVEDRARSLIEAALAG